MLDISTGQKILERQKYKKIEHLGSGGFSHVYKCLNPKNELVAAKVTFGNTDDERTASKIIQKIKPLDYDKFAKFGAPIKGFKERSKAFYKFTNKPTLTHSAQHYGLDSSVEKIDIYEAPLASEDLYSKLGKLFDENKKRRKEGEKAHINFIEIRKTAKQLFTVLKTMHARGLVHLDIKPENILQVSSGGKTINQLSDFGLIEDILDKKGEVRFIDRGTPEFMAPEIFKNEGKIELSYITKLDMYSCGVTLLDMYLTSGAKKRENDLEGAIKKVRQGKYLFKLDSDNQYKRRPIKELMFHDLVMKLLDEDPGDRLSAAEALSHPFITSNWHKPQV